MLGFSFLFHRTPRTPEKKALLLRALAETGNVSRACESSFVPRRTYYEWLKADPEFNRAARESISRATDMLELEARRRACEGVERKKFHQGEPVIDPVTGKHYVEREYSDILLICLLKAHRPKKYRERFEQQHTGKNGKELPVIGIRFASAPERNGVHANGVH